MPSRDDAPSHRFLRACLRLPVDRTPVWMMRQAGRYLPQYRAVRATTSFLGLCKNPELACEVTMQPINEFGFDAAILFSDILIPVEAMGVPLEFGDEGPKLEPLRDRAAIARLIDPDPEATMPFVPEAVRCIKRALDGRVPLIGFAGAPFTLAAYAVEGSGSKEWRRAKALLFSDPVAGHDLLERFTRTVCRYLEAQVAAGADAVQIFDSWAGTLSPADFDEFALRWARELISRLRASPAFAARRVPIIYFANGCAPYLGRLASSGADVLGIDWRVDLGEARARLGSEVAVQGNLDPAALFAPPSEIERRVEGVIRSAGDAPGHIFNLGHGVQPETNPEHVRAMVAAVHRYGVRTAQP
ncbi:MAG: uroporphyrinogen decarboxylase [Myxococcales bacterium]|nr:uroporphyrinogen decarboxylase [Myxococcales bacterium]